MFQALRNTLALVLDTVLPPKARTERTNQRSIADIPLEPATQDLLGTRVTTLMDYRKPAVQDLIRSMKYDGSHHAAQIAADVLADYLREELAATKAFSTRKVLLMPVPLHEIRERERGYNQVQRVLDALPAEFLPYMMPPILERSRATKPQTHFMRTDRLSNVASAFSLSDPSIVDNCHVYLIDDVTTTGATLANASQPLRRAGATVSLIALARA